MRIWGGVMKIYNEQPIEVLWKILKTVTGLNIYKEEMDEDNEKSIPNSYVLIRTKLTDSPKNFGDGLVNLRVSDCDVLIVSKGKLSTLHKGNCTKVRNVLNDFAYSEFFLGYDESTKETTTTFNLDVFYTV